MKPLVFKKSRRAARTDHEPAPPKLHAAKGDPVPAVRGADRGAAPGWKEPKATGPADPAAATQGESLRAPRGKEKKAKKPEGERAAPREPAGPPSPPPEPAPRPRLLDFYEQRVRAKLAQQFGFGKPHEVPTLVQTVVNVGKGDAPKNPKRLEAAVAQLPALTRHPALETHLQPAHPKR